MNIVQELSTLQGLESLTKEAGAWTNVRKMLTPKKRKGGTDTTPPAPQQVEVKATSASSPTPPEPIPAPKSSAPEKVEPVAKTPEAGAPKPETPKKPFEERAKEWWAKDRNKVGVAVAGSLATGAVVGSAMSSGRGGNTVNHF